MRQCGHRCSAQLRTSPHVQRAQGPSSRSTWNPCAGRMLVNDCCMSRHIMGRRALYSPVATNLWRPSSGSLYGRAIGTTERKREARNRMRGAERCMRSLGCRLNPHLSPTTSVAKLRVGPAVFRVRFVESGAGFGRRNRYSWIWQESSWRGRSIIPVVRCVTSRRKVHGAGCLCCCGKE